MLITYCSKTIDLCLNGQIEPSYAYKKKNMYGYYYFCNSKVNLRVTFFPFQKYSLLLIMSLFFLRINIVTNSKITRIAPAFQII